MKEIVSVLTTTLKKEIETFGIPIAEVVFLGNYLVDFKKLTIAVLVDNQDQIAELNSYNLGVLIASCIKTSDFPDESIPHMRFMIKKKIDYDTFLATKSIHKQIFSLAKESGLKVMYARPWMANNYIPEKIRILVGVGNMESKRKAIDKPFTDGLRNIINASKLTPAQKANASIFIMDDAEQKLRNNSDWKQFMDSPLIGVTEIRSNFASKGDGSLISQLLAEDNYEELIIQIKNLSGNDREKALSLIYLKAEVDFKASIRKYGLLKVLKEVDGEGVSEILEKLVVKFKHNSIAVEITEVLEQLKVNSLRYQYYLAWNNSHTFSPGIINDNFLASHRVPLIAARVHYTALRLTYRDKKLAAIGKKVSGGYKDRPYREKEEEMLYSEPPLHDFFQFKNNEKGLHSFGGNFPSDISDPGKEIQISFQYLGIINNQDKAYKWLPFNIHLMCPIFLNFRKLYIDYSDPNNPAIHNLQDIKAAALEESSYPPDLQLEFESFSFKANKTKRLPDKAFGFCGVPEWSQAIDIPVSPKNGKMMKMLCQLRTTKKIKVANHNYNGENPILEKAFNNLHFYDDGSLFIFFEPESKMACYFIQNT